jgi:DNA-binding transcriptional LysR family regulator
MPSPIELWQLRYFVTVAEELSFRRAAERLSISQPPLSRQVQALEENIGVRLLERDRTGVELTAAGLALLFEARKLLGNAEGLVGRVRDRAAQRQPLRIGMTTVLDASLFGWLEPALHACDAGLQLSLRRQYSQRCVADIRSGKLDAALIGLPCAAEGLAVEPLFADPLVVALPAGDPLRRRRRVALAELAERPLFWPQRKINPAYFDHFERVFQGLGFAPARLPEPEDHHVLLGLIAEGQGVALVPASLTAIRREGVVYRQMRETEVLRIGVALARLPHGGHPCVPMLLTVLRARYGVGA